VPCIPSFLFGVLKAAGKLLNKAENLAQKFTIGCFSPLGSGMGNTIIIASIMGHPKYTTAPNAAHIKMLLKLNNDFKYPLMLHSIL